MKPAETKARLARLRRRARLVLWTEALLRAALAPCGVMLAYLLLVLLGLGGLLTEAAALAALAAALLFAMRRFQGPSFARIDRRIEQVTGLDHRPINATEDRLIPSSELAAALWQAHQARAAAQIAGARTGVPQLRLAEHDPLALRAGLLLGLLVAAIIAGSALPERLADLVILPRWPAGQGAEIAAWLTPPAWSGEAPRLIGASHRITALRGSRFSMIATGAGRQPPAARFTAQKFTSQKLRFAKLGAGSFRTALKLSHNGEITAGSFWHRIARYRVVITKLTLPRVAFAALPMPDPDGKRVDIAYHASDSYGLAAIALHIIPAAAPKARPETAPIGSPARARTATATVRLDLLSSPYAGLPVTARLTARDIAGGTASSAPAMLTLPAPVLKNASARAIEALRQRLALDPASRAGTARGLSQLAAAPPGPLTAATDLRLVAFAEALARQGKLAAHPVTQLWNFVQQAEQGRAYSTAKALARAQAALSHALSKMLAKHQIDQNKLNQLLNNLNKALAAHMAALNTQDEHNQAQNAQPFDPQTINRLAQQIAQEERQGKQAAARRDMQKLQRMLKQLQSAKPMNAADKARGQAAAKAGSALSKLIQGEAHLLGKTASPSASLPGSGAPQAPSLSAAQQQLRQALQQLQHNLAAHQLPPLPGLGASGKAMGQAGAHLQQGDQPGAMPGERAAIAGLQQAAAALAKLGNGQQQGLSGLGQRGTGKTGQSGMDEHGSIDLKTGNKPSPAQKIEQDIMHRDANPALPAPAHHYYHRLLGHQY
jgi:hypothetical protein